MVTSVWVFQTQITAHLKSTFKKQKKIVYCQWNKCYFSQKVIHLTVKKRKNFFYRKFIFPGQTTQSASLFFLFPAPFFRRANQNYTQYHTFSDFSPFYSLKNGFSHGNMKRKIRRTKRAKNMNEKKYFSLAVVCCQLSENLL